MTAYVIAVILFMTLAGFIWWASARVTEAKMDAESEKAMRAIANKRTDEVKNAGEITTDVYSLPDGAARNKLLSKWRRD